MKSSTKYILIALAHLLTLNLFAIDTDKLIGEGNSAYNQGLYDSALINYQKVINGLFKI